MTKNKTADQCEEDDAQNGRTNFVWCVKQKSRWSLSTLFVVILSLKALLWF